MTEPCATAAVRWVCGNDECHNRGSTLYGGSTCGYCHQHGQKVTTIAAAWVVEFDERSDDGARLVGPFPTKAEGRAWLARQTFDYAASVVPMEAPDGT